MSVRFHRDLSKFTLLETEGNVLYIKNSDKGNPFLCLPGKKLNDYKFSLFSDVTQLILVVGLPTFRDEISLPSSSTLNFRRVMSTTVDVPHR